MSSTVLINFYEPDYIGTRVLAAYLQKKGHKAHIIQYKTCTPTKFSHAVEKHYGYQLIMSGTLLRDRLDVNPVTKKELDLLSQVLRNLQPDIVGISARSANNALIPLIYPFLKKGAPNALLVAGGYGPTLNPEVYLHAGIDLVVRGDGEEALAELAEAPHDMARNRRVLNCSYLENGGIRHNALRPQKTDLSEFPSPLYGREFFTCIENDCVHNKNDIQEKTTLYITLIGRGCIGKCTYCSGGHWYDIYKTYHNKVFKRRNRRLDDVLNELENIDKDIWKYINFNDEIFTAPHHEIKKFFQKYRQKIRLPFFIYLNYAQMLKHQDVFETVLDAGWSNTGIGLQSGSERLCRDLYHRQVRNADYLAYAKQLFAHNVYTDVHLIGGNCYEEKEDFEQTLSVVRTLPFSITDPAKNKLRIFRIQAHPKSPILELAPRLLSHPIPAGRWQYRAALCELRRITSDDEFAEIRSSRLYKNRPDLLLPLYRSLLWDLQREYFTNLVHKHEGTGALFYGAGDLYQKNKQIFAAARPQAIILDKEYHNGQTHIDGLRIISPDMLKDYSASLPIIIFSNMATMIQRKLVRTYSVQQERIHTCTTILADTGKRNWDFSS